MADLRFSRVFTWALALSLAVQTPTSSFSPPYPKAMSDLREAVVKGLGFQADDFKISGFDFREALVGQSAAYEFDVEIDNKVLPLRLMEDVKRWEYVDLPIFRVDDEHGLIEKSKSDILEPVLAPFQLAGPMEIWIQDAKDMRVALPHDVDAGVLRKVILADGAVVTVKGARSVSLRQPLDLPLPLNHTGSSFASGLLSLAEHLRHASQSKDGAPILSIRIVGPTSLTSPSSFSSPASNRLKLKRLAPGFVELSSPSIKPITGKLSAAIDLHQEAPTLLSPSQFATLWPFTSINGTNANLLGFEKLLSSVLGPKAQKKGSFRLLKADASAQTYLKIGFGVEKKLTEQGGEENKALFEGFPEWRTKPEKVRMHFEVLAKVEGDKVVPERIMQVNPVQIEDSVAPNLLSGNITLSTVPIVNPPQKPLTL